jgi:tetratricopeptide (TPR) repeat protein
MAVFVGGFTIEAAEELMAGLDGIKTDVLQGLSALVDGSLVRVQAEPSGRYRYGMLESIREFALDRLAENNELDAASRAHATYFVQLIEQDESRRHEGDEHTWLQLQHYEVQNLHAARQWLSSHPDPELELRLATAGGVYWILEGNLEARRSRLEGALDTSAAKPAEGSDAFVKARITLGDTLSLLGDLDQARDVLTDALARARAVDDEGSIAICLVSLGWCRTLRGELDAATRELEEGLALAEAVGDRLQVARAQVIQGEVARLSGHPARSIACLEGGLMILRDVGDLALTAAALTGLALSRAQTGDVARAAAHLRESLEIGGNMQNPWLLNVTGERTVIVASDSVDGELVAELTGALDGLKRRQGVRGIQVSAEQERLQALTGELEGRLGYAAFYSEWQCGSKLSIEETISLTGRVLDSLSAAALGSVDSSAGDTV